MIFLKNHNVFTNSQFGFRQKHSTIHALLNFVDKVTHAIDNSSNFYYTILTTIIYFISFLITAYVGRPWSGSGTTLITENSMFFLNDHNSTLKEINWGVPQGSLLGPLLFIVYINDFCRSSNILSFILFADDSNVFFFFS